MGQKSAWRTFLSAQFHTTSGVEFQKARDKEET